MIVDGKPSLGGMTFPREPEPADVGFFDALGPAFRQENMVGALATRIAAPSTLQTQEPVNVWAQIEGTPYEEFYENFESASTAGDVAAIKGRIDRENADRRTLDEAGVSGVMAQLLAGTLDLPSLIPGGVLFGGMKAGVTAGRLAARTAAVAAGEATVVEGVLQSVQETRTAAESAFAIGGSAILGGALGGAAGAVLARSAAGREAFTSAARAIEAPGSLSAATRIKPEITDFALPTRAAETVRNMTPGGLSFTDRFAKAKAMSARKLGGDLVANEYAYEGTSRLGLEPSVERLVDVASDRYQAIVARSFKDDFREYAKGGGTLTRRQYSERVAAAMRRDDQDPDTAIARTAQRLRDEVVEPLKVEAIRMGILPENVTPKTAASYFSRMWDQNRIIARSDEFIERLAAKFEADEVKGVVRTETKTQDAVAAAMNDLRDLTEARGGSYDDVTEFLANQPAIKSRRAELAKQAKGIVKRPAADYVRNAGGVRIGSTLAQELNYAGVTPKTAPGLFRKQGGLTDVDNIPLEDANLRGFVGDDGYYYDRQEFLTRLSDELTGRAALRPDDQGILDEISALDELVTEGRAKAKGQNRLDEMDRIRKARAKVETVSRRNREAAIRSNQSADEIRTYAREMARDVYDTLTNAESPLDGLNITAKARGPLKERTLGVQDVDFEDFLLNDAEFVLSRYGRIMSAEVELTRRFGRADMRDQIAEIRQEYGDLRDAAKTEKERVAIDNEMRKVIKSLEAARDMVRGTYNQKAKASAPYRAMQGLMTYNFVRALGDVVRSSLTDVFKLTMVNGIAPVARDAIVPMIRNLKNFRAKSKDAAEWAGIAEVLLNNRIMRLADITDPYARQTPVEAMTQWMGSKASLFSGVMHWNQFLKEMTVQLATNRMARMAGNLAERDKRFLKRHKINDAMWERITDEMNAHGVWSGGVYDPGLSNWNPDIRRVWTAAMRGESDTVIVTPGVGDRIPLVEEYWALKPAMQFKAFAMASHRKTMLVGLQEDQARFVQSALLMVSMGMFVYWLKSLSAERDNMSDNPGTWLAEGIDRSGVVPIVMEMNNMMESTGAPGAYYALGSLMGETPQRASRYKQRNAAGALLGPTAGLLQDARTVATLPFADDVTPGDVGAGRRLVPFGNHPGIKEFLNLWAVPEMKEAVE